MFTAQSTVSFKLSLFVLSLLQSNIVSYLNKQEGDKITKPNLSGQTHYKQFLKYVRCDQNFEKPDSMGSGTIVTWNRSLLAELSDVNGALRQC